MFLEILPESQPELRRAPRDAIAGAVDPMRRLELGVRAAFDWWAGHPEIANLVQFAATEEVFSRALRRGQEVALGDVDTHIKAAIAEGQIRYAEPEALAHAVLGLTGHLARELVHRRGDDPGEVADLAVPNMFAGLRR